MMNRELLNYDDDNETTQLDKYCILENQKENSRLTTEFITMKKKKKNFINAPKNSCNDLFKFDFGRKFGVSNF